MAGKDEGESLKVLNLHFKSVKDKSILHIHFDYDNNYKMTISHNSMEIVGNSGCKPRRASSGHVHIHRPQFI
jgi:predicted phosphoadenosine phosphosulfate sulfurtransferase